jgi:hypothetical protein
MHEITINNSEELFFVLNYFYEAFPVYLTSLGNQIDCFSHDDIIEQKIVYSDIFKKLSKDISLDLGKLEFKHFLDGRLNFPINVTFDNDEKFWFEYIINMNFNNYYDNFTTLKNICDKKDIDYKPEYVYNIYKHFESIDNIEIFRKNFIFNHKIENTPNLVGFKNIYA